MIKNHPYSAILFGKFSQIWDNFFALAGSLVLFMVYSLFFENHGVQFVNKSVAMTSNDKLQRFHILDLSNEVHIYVFKGATK